MHPGNTSQNRISFCQIWLILGTNSFLIKIQFDKNELKEFLIHEIDQDSSNYRYSVSSGSFNKLNCTGNSLY